MTYKKILILFLLIFTIFGFTTVFGADISTTNVSSDLHNYVEKDQRIFLNVLHENNIYSFNDFQNFLKNSGVGSSPFLFYYCVCPMGYYVDNNGSLAPTRNNTRYVYFTIVSRFPESNSGSGTWYNVQTDFKSVDTYGLITFRYGLKSLNFKTSDLPYTFPIPSCWQWYSMQELFIDDNNSVTNSINDLSETLTQDNSSQTDINLTTHNDEMNNASDTIKNSNLYNKFSNLSNDLQDAFTYNDDDVTTLPVSFNKKNVVLKSNEISKFFRDNNLDFVITLWKSILWFSLLYTMFLFIRKIYKSVSGGNPIDDVQNTLSNEDDKLIGGF